MPHLKDQDGFTLLEILAAISMLIIALLGMASVTVMVVKGNDFSRTMSAATTLAAEKIEGLKNTRFDSASLASGNYNDAANPINILYTRTWAVADTMDATNTQIVMKTVTVTVTWPWQGQTRTVTTKTIIYNPFYDATP